MVVQLFFYGLLVILASSRGKSCWVEDRDGREEREIYFLFNIILFFNLFYFIRLYVKIKIRMFFAIYASPRYAERQCLWDNLSSIANLHSLPWAIAGDFNEILMSDDKFGGRIVNINRALRFQDCLDNCKMLDIEFTGPHFT